jgi:argininosuccinate lyase
MKLWSKGVEVEKKIETFTVGKDRELDLLLAKYDVQGSLAHTQMLESIGLLTADELARVQAELKNIYKEIEAGDFTINDGVEDIHSQVEFLLTERLGEVGKKIHSGRSRNDQVLVDLKLFIRSEIETLVGNTKDLFDKLIELSNEHKEVLLPGYTHLQVAMPSSFGLWFGAYAESLLDDLTFMQGAYKVANRNPLGSAAGYGSSFPLNRQMTTDLLGFDTMAYNVVYAQMGRGKTERTVASAMAGVAGTLAKFAQDTCMYMSQNFAFVKFPDHLTTGSSIMPHKKNPDVWELMRSKCNKLQALPNEIALMIANLPSGYFRDLQTLKESFLPAFVELNNCLEIATYMLHHITVNKNILDDDKYLYLFSVEEVNKRVLAGKPFRDAYKEVGLDIEAGNFNPSKKVNHTHEGTIGNLCNDKIADQMDATLKGFDFDTYHKAIVELLK